jgi:hypothetical protein
VRHVFLLQLRSQNWALAVTLNDDHLGDPITSNLDLIYEDLFLYAHIKGKFTTADYDSNNIIKGDNSEVPEFVQKYEKMLGRKRQVPDSVSCFRILSCFRLLIDEVRCAQVRRISVKRFSKSILILQRRIPPSHSLLPTGSRLTTLSPFRPSVRSCGIPQMMETEGSSRN